MPADPSLGTAPVASEAPASEGHLHRLVHGIRAILWECDHDWRFTFVSESAQDILGYPLQQWFDDPEFWVHHLHPVDRDAAVQSCMDGVAAGGDFQQEFRMMAADGSAVWLHDVVTVVRGEDDVQLRGVMLDISDRRAAELALACSEDRLRRAQESASIGTFDWNIETNEVVWDGVEAIHGLPAGSFEGSFEAYARDIHPEDRERVIASIFQAVERGEDLNIEYRIVRPDGSEPWVAGNGRAIKDGLGRVVRVAGTCMDIDSRKRVERANEFQAHLLETVGDAVIATDFDGSITYWNRSAENLYGWPADEVLGRNIGLVTVSAEAADASRAIMEDLRRGNAWSGEIICRKRDGTQVPVHVTNTPVRDAEGKIVGIIGVSHDISERREAQRALEASERKYRELANAVPTMIALFRPDGRAALYNDRWYEYSGLTPQDTMDGGWRKILHPDVLDEIMQGWQSSLASGEPMETEALLRRADGSYRWHLGRSMPIRDADGAISGVIVAAVDIHDRKAAEDRIADLNQALERQVQELDVALDGLREANQAKDEFLGLVSHELRTPITTIYGNAQVLRRRASVLDEESREVAIADIEQEAERLHRIVENMLVLARIETGRADVAIEPVLLQRIAAQVVADHRGRFPSRPIELSVPDDLPAVLGEPVYLEQVIRNLISNAEKYSDHGRPIEVEVAVKDGHACVSVLDRGAGITADEAGHIFDAFYRSERTSVRASGAGIGLAVCKRLIEAQTGHVWARPRDGGGSEVGFALPMVKEVTR